jgi:hypothetical protein
MSVARLLHAYFLGSAVTRWFTRAGVVLLAIAVFVVIGADPSLHVLAFAMLGITSLFLGTALMPITLGRLSQSRTAHLLPGVRIKLLVSALLTILVVALPVGVLTPLVYITGNDGKFGDLTLYPELREFMLDLAWTAYTSAILIAFWMYLLAWCVTNERNLVGMAKGLVVLLILLFAPAREFQNLSSNYVWNLQQIAVLFTAFTVLFLSWPRLSNYFAAWRRPRPAAGTGETTSAGSKDIAGKEVDLIFGNANPWLFVAALAVPIFAASRVGRSYPAVWLLYLTIASTVAGALSGQSAERSRALWLRTDWTRAELFSVAENSAWRHNGLILGALVMFMLIGGIASDMPRFVLLAGIPIVVLGTVLSTYLGLMVTQGVRFPEVLLGVGVMLALMSLSLMVDSQSRKPMAIATLLLALTGLAVFLRNKAWERWSRMDWTECRRERTSTSRSRA